MAKCVFQLHGVDARGGVMLSRAPIADVLFGPNGSVALIVITSFDCPPGNGRSWTSALGRGCVKTGK